MSTGGGAPPPPRSAGSRYGWFLGVVGVLFIAYVTLNTASTDHVSTGGIQANRPLPPFAAPIATSALEGDANVARESDQGRAGRRPACSVRGPDVLNVCQLADRGPVALAFIATRGGNCQRILDRLATLRRRYPDVQIAGIAIRGSRKDLRALVRRHHWPFPVGHDRDGAVANLYGVAVCPEITFAYPGGIVAGTAIGQLKTAEIARRLRSLVTGSRARGWTPSR
jgi:AhpC/TSA family protein